MNRVKSFLAGFASAFDITGGNSGRPYSSRGFERDMEAFARDREAIAGDWRQVGNDLRWAMNQVKREAADGKRQ